MRRRVGASAAALLLAVVALFGCGGPPGDLLELEQTVSGGGRQNIIIENNGEAACNNGKQQDIGSKALLDARELERELGDLADTAAVFDAPAGTQAVRTYVARLKKGTVRWQDPAARLPPVLAKAQLMTLRLARKLC
jgi:hypothetical protein